MELNRDNFDLEVLEVREPVLVDFWGPQCKPCLALMPAVEKLERDYRGRLKVGKVNVAQNRMLCAKLRVMGLPTLVIYRDGVEMKRIVGDHIAENDLREAIEAVLTQENR